jgi:GNAT superfamily N-acetyltransferase
MAFTILKIRSKKYVSLPLFDQMRTFRAKNGLLLRIRSLQPEDARHLVNLFDHMGQESRYLRFNLALTDPSPDLVWAEAERLARIDPEQDGAWLVFADLPDQPEAPIAGARFVRTDETTAEVSMAVRDDLQNQGVGSHLLRFVIEQARAAGVGKLTAAIQRNNRPLWYLLKHSGLKLEITYDGSTALVETDLADGGANG